MNNLKDTLSPYLQKHSKNPINWYPYDEFALKKARNENKPIFLSIGYSTCHWCFVMEEECFEDKEIAKILNENYISIKVDREERPDIDEIYISFLFFLKGSAGWPLNVFLTPELKPFFGGSYFPKETFKEIILKIANLWDRERETVQNSAENIYTEMKNFSEFNPEKEILPLNKILEKAFENLKKNFDFSFGGFHIAPKFPMAPSLKFLLNYYRFKKEEDALNMVLFTLKKITRGGIMDHLSGGFHRYAIDREWKIPHFEKMIYDQLLLIDIFLDSYNLTKENLFKRIAEKTLNFILKEMKTDGGFFSALNADSLNDEGEREEGFYYRFSEKQIEKILGKEKAMVFFENYGIQDGVIFQKGEEENKEILKELLKEREMRKKPDLDDKIITGYQGLGISVLCKAYLILREEIYLKEAISIKNFVSKNLFKENGKNLYRYLRNGIPSGNGFLEDYAFLIKGLLVLFSITGDKEDLNLALKIQEEQDRLFFDLKEGVYFNTSMEDILFKTKDEYEGPYPSGSSIAFINLLKLSKIKSNNKYYEISKNLLNYYLKKIQSNPLSMASLLSYSFFLENYPETMDF